MRYKKVNVTEDEFFYLPQPENYKDCLTLINSDLCREKKRKKSTLGIILHILTHPLSILVWHRLCSHKGILILPCMFFRKLSSAWCKIDFPRGTQIGYGFNISHKMCMVINGRTIIGNNVNVGQFLNIGTNHGTAAIIGDNVYIGPSVCIIEDVRIHTESTIGAGAVVTRDIPAKSTCAGCPAKVLNYNDPGRYVKNRYEFTVPEDQR